MVLSPCLDPALQTSNMKCSVISVLICVYWSNFKSCLLWATLEQLVVNTLCMKFKQYCPALTGQLTYVVDILGGAAFEITVLRVMIDFLYSSSIWCSYWTLLLLLYKLLQGKIWLDLGNTLHHEGGQTLEQGARETAESQSLETSHSTAQGAEQPDLSWSCFEWGLDGLQRSLATSSMVLCFSFFFF